MVGGRMVEVDAKRDGLGMLGGWMVVWLYGCVVVWLCGASGWGLLLSVECWVLGVECWVLGVECWVLGVGLPRVFWDSCSSTWSCWSTVRRGEHEVGDEARASVWRRAVFDH